MAMGPQHDQVRGVVAGVAEDALDGQGGQRGGVDLGLVEAGGGGQVGQTLVGGLAGALGDVGVRELGRAEPVDRVVGSGIDRVEEVQLGAKGTGQADGLVEDARRGVREIKGGDDGFHKPEESGWRGTVPWADHSVSPFMLSLFGQRMSTANIFRSARRERQPEPGAARRCKDALRGIPPAL